MNTNTYGHGERRSYRSYNTGSYNTKSYDRSYNTGSYNTNNAGYAAPAPAPTQAPAIVPSDFPALGLGKTKTAPVINSGKFNALEEVVDVKPVSMYASIIGTKVSDKPVKKIEEKAKMIKKSDRIDTNGKKVYMTQQQFLYNGHKYNAEDVIIVDDDGQEIYFSDDDNDCDEDNSDNEYEEDDN